MFLPFDSQDGVYHPEMRCTKCHLPKRSARKERVRLTFQGGRCADFYTYVGPMLCAQDVAIQLAEHFAEAESRPVEILDSIPFPCSPIVELWPRKNISRFHPDSDIRASEPCSSCGRSRTQINWMEDEITYPDERGEMAYRIGEIPGRTGIKLYKSDFCGDHIVTFNESFPICTEAFKAFIELKGWTNVTFIRAGILI